MNIVLAWISNNYIELAGSILGIAYVLLASRQNILCWLMGIISCALYIIIFFMSQLYGDMTLQAFYLIMGFYGWYIWHKRNHINSAIEISNISNVFFFVMVFSILIMTIIFGYILSFTDDPIPYTDGFTNALGIAGTWMTARKYLESWLLWIFANLFCVGVYYYKGLYPTVVFYFIMTLLAYRGYVMWKKELNTYQNA